jgi:hypothetical protein
MWPRTDFLADTDIGWCRPSAEAPQDASPQLLRKRGRLCRTIASIRRRTLFLLMAQYNGQTVVPLDQVCRDFLRPSDGQQASPQGVKGRHRPTDRAHRDEPESATRRPFGRSGCLYRQAPSRRHEGMSSAYRDDLSTTAVRLPWPALRILPRLLTELVGRSRHQNGQITIVRSAILKCSLCPNKRPRGYDAGSPSWHKGQS